MANSKIHHTQMRDKSRKDSLMRDEHTSSAKQSIERRLRDYTDKMIEARKMDRMGSFSNERAYDNSKLLATDDVTLKKIGDFLGEGRSLERFNSN